MMKRLPQEPRITKPSFFEQTVDWMREAARALNPLVDAIGDARSGTLTMTQTMDGPAFSAYLSTNQSVAINSTALVLFDTKTFDTANCYNPANGRFTPNVRGYYRVAFQALQQFSVGGTNAQCALSLNGSEYARGSQWVSGGTGNIGFFNSTGSDLVLLNGTTDYLSVYVTNGAPSGTATVLGAISYTKFSAHLARRA